MDDQVARRLAVAVAELGLSAFEDAKRREEILISVCEGQPRWRALESAYSVGIIADMENEPSASMIDKLTRQLRSRAGLNGGLARFAVETWAQALWSDPDGETVPAVDTDDADLPEPDAADLPEPRPILALVPEESEPEPAPARVVQDHPVGMRAASSAKVIPLRAGLALPCSPNGSVGEMVLGGAALGLVVGLVLGLWPLGDGFSFGRVLVWSVRGVAAGAVLPLLSRRALRPGLMSAIKGGLLLGAIAGLFEILAGGAPVVWALTAAKVGAYAGLLGGLVDAGA